MASSASRRKNTKSSKRVGGVRVPDAPSASSMGESSSDDHAPTLRMAEPAALRRRREELEKQRYATYDDAPLPQFDDLEPEEPGRESAAGKVRATQRPRKYVRRADMDIENAQETQVRILPCCLVLQPF